MNANSINVGGNIVSLDTPIVMGILNITTDSFYSASRCTASDEILARIYQIVSEGAAIVDIGAYSTRPSANDVSESVEIERISMALDIIKCYDSNIIVSVDTFRSNVAAFAIEHYDKIIINDISGGNLDANMFSTIAKYSVPYILTHSRGTPRTMQDLTNYEDLIGDIVCWFSERIRHLNSIGVCDIIIDPGFGFAKTVAQNYKMLAHLAKFGIFSMPILAGLSRKSMIYKALGTTQDESLTGTIALNTIALQNGASILRVHDVRAAVETIKLYELTKNNY